MKRPVLLIHTIPSACKTSCSVVQIRGTCVLKILIKLEAAGIYLDK